MGCIISGVLTAGYAFVAIVQYCLKGSPHPILGMVSMAFSTAVLFLIVGLAIGWAGWIIRRIPDDMLKFRSSEDLSRADMIHLISAALSAASLIAAAAIAAWVR